MSAVIVRNDASCFVLEIPMPVLRLYLAIVIVFAGPAWAQSSTPNPDVPITNEIVGPPLVAWSNLQKPVPEVARGVIVRDDSAYTLKLASGGTYLLKSELNVQAFEGREVQVSGRRDLQRNVLQVICIEPIL